MVSKEVLQQVKELEIHTKRVLSGMQLGGNRSSQKGFGFEFDQLRPYQYGDDVRLIDWKGSARGKDLLVRQYFEERNRTFLICLDISASTYYGSSNMLKQDVMKQIAGVLSMVAEYSQDKVGLILFSDEVEVEIPPSKGKQHVHHIVETIFAHKPKRKTTDINVVLEHVLRNHTKHAIMFLISDFISHNFQKRLKQLVVHKEVVAISCADKKELALDNVGMIWMQDPETSEKVLVDTSKSKNQKIAQVLSDRVENNRSFFAQHRVDFLHIASKDRFIHDLVMFFKKRLMY